MGHALANSDPQHIPVADPAARARREALDPRVRAKLEDLEERLAVARAASRAQQDRVAELRDAHARAVRRAAVESTRRDIAATEAWPGPGIRITTVRPVVPTEEADAAAHLERQLALANDAAAAAASRMHSLDRVVAACCRHLGLEVR